MKSIAFLPVNLLLLNRLNNVLISSFYAKLCHLVLPPSPDATPIKHYSYVLFVSVCSILFLHRQNEMKKKNTATKKEKSQAMHWDTFGMVPLHFPHVLCDISYFTFSNCFFIICKRNVFFFCFFRRVHAAAVIVCII